MYSVDEFLGQADQASDVDDDLERVVEQDDENGPREDEAEEATEKKDDEEGSSKKVAKKVRKPSNRPKLDVERLKGPRGLASIEKLFTKVKFQGNGHEQEDLQAVMRTLHYWCHRLFPKYSFDDCLEHLERLGSKKPLITLKKKILYDLFEEDQPIVNDDADDANPDTQEAINEFDLLLQQEPISTLSQRSVTPERIELTEEQKEMIERNRLLAAERRKARLEALQQKHAESLQNQNVTQNLSSPQLTEEQKAIIERNRQQALERRQAKNNLNISITTSMVPSSQDPNSTIDTVTNSQKSNPSVNFNELVDSFFPASNDNPEDITEKSDDEGVDINDLIEENNPTIEEKSTEVVTPDEANKEIESNEVVKPKETNKEIESNEDDVEEENNPNTTIEGQSIEVVKPVKTNKEIESNEDNVDINDLLGNTNSEINTTVTKHSETELNQKNQIARSPTKIVSATVEDKMDVDVLENDKELETSTEVVKPDETKKEIKSNEDDVDINDLLEDTSEINTTVKPSETELDHQNKIATSPTKIFPATDKMDVDVLENDKELEKSIEVVKPDETNKEIESNEDDVDINALLEDTTSEINKTELNQQDQIAINPTKIVSATDKMDVDVLENDKKLGKPDNSNPEISYDMNSTKEDTTANLLEME